MGLILRGDFVLVNMGAYIWGAFFGILLLTLQVVWQKGGFGAIAPLFSGVSEFFAELSKFVSLLDNL